MRAPEKGVVGSAVVDAGQRSGPRTTRPARTACRQTPAQVRSPEPPACPVSRPSAPQRSQIPRKYITPYLSALPPAGRHLPLLTELEFVSIAQLQRCRPAGAG